jgi:putative holliday junction resolvase
MILGVDPGARRIGLALADAETHFARPLEVVDARRVDPVARIAEVVDEAGVTIVVVGRPVSLSGAAGPAVAAQSAFVDALRARLEVPVREHDERLTSVIAERSLRAAGASARRRRRMRDAVAAQAMLQGYLDSAR